MDMTAIDSRIKSLMRIKHLTYDEAKQLLQETNWDVSRACELYSQRVSAQPLPLSSYAGRIDDLGVTRVQVNRPSQMFVEEAEPIPKTSSSSSEDLPKSSASDPGEPNMSGPRLVRGMSKATINHSIVMIARDILQKDAAAAMTTDHRDEDDAKSFIQTTEFTFVLPDLTRYPEDFKAFLYKDLIDMATLVSLEQGGHLNWWADVGACQRLLPMVTSGDGNGLLHAASLGMWGFHDRQLILRKMLSDALTRSSAAETFKRRWRYQQTMINRLCNLVLSEAEWEDDWKFLIQLSSAEPRSATKTSTDSVPRYERSYAGQSFESEPIYESLEELHVFVLAYVLRRPIIVIAKTVLQDAYGEALAPIPFGGIYLPLEWDARQCHSAPLLLTYDLSHFCALVSMEASPGGASDLNLQLPDAIPLVNPKLSLLPVHFAIDPGPGYDFSKDLNFSLSDEEKMSLVRNYFVVEQVPIPQVQREMDVSPEVLSIGGVLKTELTKSDSEESGGSGKDRMTAEDFDKKSLPKPMKFITKSIDKIKNITKINKMGKLERKASIGFATQSTRKSSVAVEMLADQNFVLCARLRQRKTGYQDQLVSNYLAMMKEKFTDQHVRRQQQHAEIVRLSAEMRNLHHRSDENFGRANERLGVVVDRGQVDPTRGQRDSRVVSSYNDLAFQRQNTIVVAGKSKFYTAASEEQCPVVDCGVEPKDLMKKEKGFSDADPSVRKYNKIDTMQLQTVQEGDYGTSSRLTKPDLISWGTLPLQGSKVGLDEDPQRRNVASKRMVSDRYSADPSVFRNLRDAPGNPPDRLSTIRPSASSQNYVGLLQKESGHSSVARNASSSLCDPANPVDPMNREPKRENGIRLKEAERRLCRTDGCKFYGTYETNFLCSQCFKHEKTFRPCLNANCTLEGSPSQDNLCALCYQKKCYSKQVQYPIAKTKF